MKRLALILAATVLGTGCYVSSDYSPPPPVYGSVNVYWDFVRNAPAQPGGAVIYDSTLSGAVDGPCPESAVEAVTVDVPGLAQVDVPCIWSGVQGVTISGIPAGTSSFRVRGWRGIHAVYDETFLRSVPAGPGPASHYLDVSGVPAAIDLFAALYWDTPLPAGQYTLCADAAFPTIDYDLFDSFGTRVRSEVAIPCSDPAAPSFPVFMGNLDLDNYTVRMKGYTGPAPGTRTFDSCTSTTATMMAFDHFGAQVGGSGVPISLYTPPRCGP